MFYHKYILIFIAIALAATPSEGYFKKNDHNEYSHTSLSETIAFSKKHDLFVPAVYKNNPQSKAYIKNNIIFGHQSDLLTELMALDIRHITKPIQSNTLESGRFIENLIYANLRIQRLIDQYNELHEDADYFQKTYLHPMASDPAKDGGPKQKDDSSSTGDFNRISSEYDLLKRQFASTSKLADTRETTRLSNSNTVGDIPVAVRDHTSSFQTFTPKRFNGSYRPRVAQQTEASSPQDKADADEKEDDRERRPPVRTSDMPWMIRFVVSTVDYFIHNKIEGMIYLGMIVFVVSVLAGGRR